MRLSVAVTAACISIVGLATADEGHAAVRKHTTILAQGLGPALQQLARERDCQVVYRSEVVGHRQTSGVTGELTFDEAVTQLLDGTGLTFQYLDHKAITIIPLSTSSAVSGGAGADARGLAATSSLAWQGSGTAGEGGRVEGQKGKSFWGRLRLAQLDQGAPSSSAAVTGEQASTEQGRTLEEIVVTAEKRAESIHDLPIAISAFSADDLVSRGIGGMESLAQLAPSVQVGDNYAGRSRITIRGVGAEVGNIGGEAAVAVSQDGVAYAHHNLFRADFFDVDRVEVLRGPQGTISGRNATAGAIYIHSNRPTDALEGGFRATLGNYNRIATEGYLSGPIVGDSVLGRLAVRADRADGWVDNTFLGQELGTIDKLQARASFLTRVGDDFEAHLILETSRDRSDYLYSVDDGRVRPDRPSLVEFYGVPGFDRDARTTQRDQISDTDLEKQQATLKLTWDLTPAMRVSAISGYVDSASKDVQDASDGTLVPAITWNPADPQALNVWQLSQEATLTADLSDRLDMILGALYLHGKADHYTSSGLPLLGVPVGVRSSLHEQDLVSWAGYGQWRYRLADTVRLTAGVRYTHDAKIYDSRAVASGVPSFVHDEDSWNAWTPRFAIDYAPNEDLTFYSSVSRGFKSGGFNAGSTPINKVEPEYVWNYEAGVKAKALAGRLTSALTAFYMEYTDLQQIIYGLVPGDHRPRMVNAEAATIEGVELEFDALITDRLRITASGTWLDATYDKLRSHDNLFPELGVAGPTGLNVRDLSGNQLVRAPKWQLNFSGEYTIPLGSNLQGVLQAAYAWQDKVFFDFYNHESLSQGDYGLINLSASVETMDGAWQLSGYVHNAADKFYRHHEQFLSFLPIPYSIAFPGQPRTYGVSLSHRF